MAAAWFLEGAPIDVNGLGTITAEEMSAGKTQNAIPASPNAIMSKSSATISA
jgi:hypothetical protein